MAYLVPSLVHLRAEIDAMWPNRDRTTDGWYAAPWVRISYGHNPDGKGAVHAIDVDKDGIWPPYIIDRIWQAQGVIWYAIWNRQYWSVDYGWKPRAYFGVSPHTDHMHIEVLRTPYAESYGGTWYLHERAVQSFGAAPPSLAELEGADPLYQMNSSGSWVGLAGDRAAAAARGVRSLFGK